MKIIKNKKANRFYLCNLSPGSVFSFMPGSSWNPDFTFIKTDCNHLVSLEGGMEYLIDKEADGSEVIPYPNAKLYLE